MYIPYFFKLFLASEKIKKQSLKKEWVLYQKGSEKKQFAEKTHLSNNVVMRTLFESICDHLRIADFDCG